jgi:hypothetical protein
MLVFDKVTHRFNQVVKFMCDPVEKTELRVGISSAAVEFEVLNGS